MGNSLSYQNVSQEQSNNTNSIKSIDKNNLIDIVDHIAVEFILKQNMIDMIRFTDKEYYDNLIILTSSILKNQLTDLEIGILQDRVLNTTNNDTNNTNNKNSLNNTNTNNNHIYFTTSNDLKNITLSNEKEKKKALRVISKFYIKIMTIFSAITSVMDPQYVYEDDNGVKQYFQLKDFNSYKMINKETQNIQLYQLYNPISLVNKRLTILKNKINQNSNDEQVTLNPGEMFCEMDKSSNNYELNNEIGLKELDLLYYDVYDYETNSWAKRSEKMEKKYNKDITRFYQIFTGKKTKPSNVKSFKDIETLQYHKLYRCQNKDFYKDVVINKSDALFVKYMKKIENIENTVSLYKKKLVKILKSIFVSLNSNGESSIVLNPSITLNEIIKLQEQSKDCILNIYSNCEKHFIEALLIYEEIYDKKYGMVNTERQIMNNNSNRPYKSKNNSRKLNNNNIVNALNSSLLNSQTMNVPNTPLPSMSSSTNSTGQLPPISQSPVQLNNNLQTFIPENPSLSASPITYNQTPVLNSQMQTYAPQPPQSLQPAIETPQMNPTTQQIQQTPIIQQSYVPPSPQVPEQQITSPQQPLVQSPPINTTSTSYQQIPSSFIQQNSISNPSPPIQYNQPITNTSSTLPITTESPVDTSVPVSSPMVQNNTTSPNVNTVKINNNIPTISKPNIVVKNNSNVTTLSPPELNNAGPQETEPATNIQPSNNNEQQQDKTTDEKKEENKKSSFLPFSLNIFSNKKEQQESPEPVVNSSNNDIEETTNPMTNNIVNSNSKDEPETLTYEQDEKQIETNMAQASNNNIIPETQNNNAETNMMYNEQKQRDVDEVARNVQSIL